MIRIAIISVVGFVVLVGAWTINLVIYHPTTDLDPLAPIINLTSDEWDQKPPSITRTAAGAFGFLVSSQDLDGPERYPSIRFETIPSNPSLQTALNISSP
jgi:hypothetical protein